MPPLPATRLSSLPPYFFAILGQRIQALKDQGVDVISLDIGSPDLPPPPDVVEALSASAHRPDVHGYSGYRGIPEFRRAVARYYERRFGVRLNPDSEVLPLLGSKEGIVNLSLAYLDRGDMALVPDIAYPSYAMGARLAGGDVTWLDMRAEAGYRPHLEDFRVPEAAKLLWLNYPNNPTGASAEPEYYRGVVEFCLQHNILLGFDNPYVDVTFDGYCATSILQIEGAKQCAVEFMSFSKTFNMGGWRLGAAVGNADAIKLLLQIKSNVDSGHFRPIYDAGIVALDTTPQAWIDARNEVYQWRRDQIMAALPEIGLRATTPKGSLYIWAEAADGDGTLYTERALNEAHVTFAPGEAYGPGGRRYIRISLGIANDRLEIALARLKHWYLNRDDAELKQN